MNRFFVDTNILIYAYSIDEAEKAEIANKILFDPHALISLQVINEFANTCLRKLKMKPSSVIDAVEELAGIVEIVSFSRYTQLHALHIHGTYGYSYYDALIIATALEQNCSVLYSEDLHHNHRINGKIRIVNPFTSQENIQ